MFDSGISDGTLYTAVRPPLDELLTKVISSSEDGTILADADLLVEILRIDPWQEDVKSSEYTDKIVHSLDILSTYAPQTRDILIIIQAVVNLRNFAIAVDATTTALEYAHTRVSKKASGTLSDFNKQIKSLPNNSAGVYDLLVDICLVRPSIDDTVQEFISKTHAVNPLSTEVRDLLYEVRDYSLNNGFMFSIEFIEHHFSSLFNTTEADITSLFTSLRAYNALTTGTDTYNKYFVLEDGSDMIAGYLGDLINRLGVVALQVSRIFQTLGYSQDVINTADKVYLLCTSITAGMTMIDLKEQALSSPTLDFEIGPISLIADKISTTLISNESVAEVSMLEEELEATSVDFDDHLLQVLGTSQDIVDSLNVYTVEATNDEVKDGVLDAVDQLSAVITGLTARINVQLENVDQLNRKISAKIGILTQGISDFSANLNSSSQVDIDLAVLFISKFGGLSQKLALFKEKFTQIACDLCALINSVYSIATVAISAVTNAIALAQNLATAVVDSYDNVSKGIADTFGFGTTSVANDLATQLLLAKADAKTAQVSAILGAEKGAEFRSCYLGAINGTSGNGALGGLIDSITDDLNDVYEAAKTNFANLIPSGDCLNGKKLPGYPSLRAIQFPAISLNIHLPINKTSC